MSSNPYSNNENFNGFSSNINKDNNITDKDNNTPKRNSKYSPDEENEPKGPNGERVKESKTCQNAEWGKILFDYSQETSFHGPKQIIEHQPFIFRRLIWLMLFLGGMVIFLLQVAGSIEYYLSWPVSVDVKINYNDSIVFPAVTICNGNAFRTTKAYEHGYYNLINDIYGSGKKKLDLSKYNISDLNLEELYTTVGHWKEDLIVGCEWDESPCSAAEFMTSMTDFGMCYTFNSEKDEGSVRWASQTGAEGGLRLQLNIEQYQYMRGPNEGAGLKILIHHPNEIPLVRDHGLAVPPGSHGLVAIKTIEVNNLEPNHGKCNDSVKLDYFPTYSVSSCYTNCKENYVVEKCGCRDIYMPSVNGEPKVCSLKEYTSCMVEAVETFRSVKNISCECPIPCHRLLYEPIVSYASTSNFDIDALLRTNSTHRLRDEYILARETTQRVNEAIVTQDTEQITTLNLTVDTLDAAFQNMNEGLTKAHNALQLYYDRLQKRINFHIDRGIDGVRFIVEHDFNRGWEVFEERSFHYVTLDFMDVPKSLKRTVQNANQTLDLSSKTDRFMVYSPILNTLMGRRELVERAVDFINESNHAYLTGEPLLTYRLTYERRYDMKYISLPLLHIGKKDQKDNFEELIEATDMMSEGLSKLQEVGDQFVNEGTFNMSTYEKGEYRYLKGCRQFNYRIFMFDTRVIAKPLEEIRNRIAEFERQNRTLHQLHYNVEWKIQQIKGVILNSINPIWQDIVNISQQASDYMSNVEVLKTPLSSYVTSKSLEESIRTLSVLFQGIRSRVRELQDELLNLKMEYKIIWTSMLLEESTKAVYETIYNDCQHFLKNETMYESYIAIFRYMLRTKSYKLRQLVPEDIIWRLNGDFHAMNLTVVLDDVESWFGNLSRSLDLGVHIGDADELFLVSFERFRQSMQTFLADNKIDTRFYRENFMRLDVFMQELSYEEITQQKSYEITQLLSDIGGSMGLFIGGSVLSVFEFIDIFVHHGARIVFNR